MSQSQVSHLATFAATVSAAFFLTASVLVSADPLRASEASPQSQGGCTCPDAKEELRKLRPKLAELETGKAALDDSDEIAALAAVHVALSETADGSTYIWHRGNGRVSGVIHPVASFKRDGGDVCRRLVLTLVSGRVARRTEGVACRMADGSWSLEG